MRKPTQIGETDETRRIRQAACDETDRIRKAAWDEASRKKKAAENNAYAEKAQHKKWEWAGLFIAAMLYGWLYVLVFGGIALFIVFLVNSDLAFFIIKLVIAATVVDAVMGLVFQPMHNRNREHILETIDAELERKKKEYDREAEAKIDREIAACQKKMATAVAAYQKKMSAEAVAYNAAYDKRVKQKAREKMANVTVLEDMRQYAVQYFEKILAKEIRNASNISQFISCTMVFAVSWSEIEYTGLQKNEITHYSFRDARYRNQESDEECEALACVLTGGIKGLLQHRYGPQQAVITSSHDAATVTIHMEMPNQKYQPLRKA